MPHWVIIKLVYFMVLWRNAIPAWKTGILAIYPPGEIITGMKMDFKKHCKLNFGKYIEVHDKPTPTNGMKFCTRSCVALGPTGNLQDTYKFMDINTGMKLKKRSWTCIPISDSVIGKLERRAEREKCDGSWHMQSWNNEEFNFDDDLEEATALTRINPDAHPDIPTELPRVELKREQDTDAMDTIDSDTDPMATVGSIENAEFGIPNVMPQDSQGNKTSTPQENQDKDIECEIIIEYN